MIIMADTLITGKISRVAGPVIAAKEMRGSRMYDVVKVGVAGLMGEIIQLRRDVAIIQVYEETSGIRPGEPVVNTGKPLLAKLGPGLLSSIFDGIQRPLSILRAASGDFIGRGISAEPLPKKKWKFLSVAEDGKTVSQGDIL